jgi:hypothetical protein
MGSRADSPSYERAGIGFLKGSMGGPGGVEAPTYVDYESEDRRVESCRALLLPCRRCFPLNSSQFYSPGGVLREHRTKLEFRCVFEVWQRYGSRQLAAHRPVEIVSHAVLEAACELALVAALAQVQANQLEHQHLPLQPWEACVYRLR